MGAAGGEVSRDGVGGAARSGEWFGGWTGRTPGRDGPSTWGQGGLLWKDWIWLLDDGYAVWDAGLSESSQNREPIGVKTYVVSNIELLLEYAVPQPLTPEDCGLRGDAHSEALGIRDRADEGLYTLGHKHGSNTALHE